MNDDEIIRYEKQNFYAMTEKQQQEVLDNVAAFSLHLEEELVKNGTIECECPICNCEKKEKLDAGKFHLFMDPEEYKCYAVCNLGLQRLSHKYGFWDKLNGPVVNNQ